MQKLLTIVVPVYKVEQYINKCLDSCIIYKADGTLDEEKMNQLEVIIVNDGTPDRSAEISREYTVRYPQTFRQIDQENRGHGGAWNHGLKEATGKYLRFLDSDDWLTNLDKLMEKLAETDADLVFTPKIHYLVTEKKEEFHSIGIEQLGVRLLTKFPFDQINDITLTNFMFTTYRRDLLQGLYPLFKEHVFYDDSILFISPMFVAKTYISLSFPVYNYYIGRAEQTMNKNTQKKNARFLLVANEYLFTFYQNHKQDIQSYELNHRCRYILSEYSIIFLDALFRVPYAVYKKYAPIYKFEICTCKESMVNSKSVKRFLTKPFWFTYVYETLRHLKNNN